MTELDDSYPDFNIWHALGLTPPAATSKGIDFTSDQIRKAWRAASLHWLRNHGSTLNTRRVSVAPPTPPALDLNNAEESAEEEGAEDAESAELGSGRAESDAIWQRLLRGAVEAPLLGHLAGDHGPVHGQMASILWEDGLCLFDQAAVISSQRQGELPNLE
ncbi:hypothetical protein CGCSCA1_v011514 [Colletotrichum siamense]|nr:hypothetical protein CGCSCA1_v011514 [Colletotrichum siamense]